MPFTLFRNAIDTKAFRYENINLSSMKELNFFLF